jgi:hypothetical protein
LSLGLLDVFTAVLVLTLLVLNSGAQLKDIFDANSELLRPNLGRAVVGNQNAGLCRVLGVGSIVQAPK